MYYRTKYRTAQIILIVATTFAVVGYMRLRSEALAWHVTKPSIIMVFAGAVVGIVAGVARLYFGSRAGGDIEAQRAAIEALAAAGARRSSKARKNPN